MLVVPEKLPSPLGVKVPASVTLKTSPPAENVATPLVVPLAKKVSSPDPARGTWPSTTGCWQRLAGTQPLSVKE